MGYLDIISLEQAKLYLRIDDTLTQDDENIERMIKSSLSYIERTTNIIFWSREKSYNFNSEGEIRVYDFPIANSFPDNTTKTEVRETYTLFTDKTKNQGQLRCLVGYATAEEVPRELVEVGYEMIDLFYYGKSTGKSIEDISPVSKSIIERYKRFWV